MFTREGISERTRERLSEVETYVGWKGEAE